MPSKRTTWYPAWVIRGLDRAGERRIASEQEHRLARGQHTLDLGERPRVERRRPCEQERRALRGCERRARQHVGERVGPSEHDRTGGADSGEARLRDRVCGVDAVSPEMRVIVLLDGLTTIGEAVMFVLGFEK